MMLVFSLVEMLKKKKNKKVTTFSWESILHCDTVNMVRKLQCIIGVLLGWVGLSSCNHIPKTISIPGIFSIWYCLKNPFHPGRGARSSLKCEACHRRSRAVSSDVRAFMQRDDCEVKLSLDSPAILGAIRAGLRFLGPGALEFLGPILAHNLKSWA